MSSDTKKLVVLQPGEKAYVAALQCSGLLRRRLTDLGFVPGTAVEVLPEAADRDPRVYRIKATTLAIRNADAEHIRISTNKPRAAAEPACLVQGFEPATPRRKAGNSENEIVVALAGNPNAGKSTVFNNLTGLNQHVGNWPGKTVSRAEGRWRYREKNFRLVDLPGTYSLLSTSVEEEVARDYLLFGNPDCTVIVADATSLERHLNLAIQIMQITARAVLCVNMMDTADRRGLKIDAEALTDRLGIPVALTAANSRRGFDDLQEAVWKIAVDGVPTHPIRIPLPEELDAAVTDLAADLEAVFPGLENTRWIAMRLIDGGDERINQEVARGLLADEEGRIGERSLEGASPTQREIKR